jgi:predicted acetyltransferase
VLFDPGLTAVALDRPGLYCYLAPDGLLIYGWDRAADGLDVDVLAAGSAATARALWSILASHGTIVRQVKAVVSPMDPVNLLAPDPGVILSRPETWMLRLVDAPAAIAGRGFPGGAELAVPLAVTDPQLPANSGTWLLEVSGGKAALTRDAGAGAGTPLRLGPRGLAALYAGTPVATLRTGGLAAGGDRDADAALDDAFGCRAFMLDYF